MCERGHAVCVAAAHIIGRGEVAIVQGDALARKPGRARPSRGDGDAEIGLLQLQCGVGRD